MAGMTPADWDQLVKQFQTNDTLFQEFYHNYCKQAPTQPCNSECKSWMLCNLVSSRSGDTLKCQTENHIDHDPQTCSDNFNNEHNSPITELNKPMLFRTEL